jgi:hypothetical protein
MPLTSFSREIIVGPFWLALEVSTSPENAIRKNPDSWMEM